MITFVLISLVFSAVATLAFVFGASVGYRRGIEEGQAWEAEPPGRRSAAARDLAREVRLPQDVQSET